MQGVLVAVLLALISIGPLGCLARSAGRGDVAGVKSHLAEGDSPDSLDFKRRSALELAIILDRKEVIDLLIQEGADVNRRGKGTRTPLIWASMRFGSAELIQQLIEAGADPDRTDGAGQTPLLYSVLYGSPAQTKALTDGGADPNKIMTPRWKTAVLDVAIRQRKPASVQVLVAKKPKPPYRR
jgi:ankyrin repeat protein